MKKILFSLALVAFAAAGIIAPFASNAASFQVVPFTFLADGANCDVQSAWVTDSSSSTNQVLFLKKGCTTATEAAAGADIISSLEGTPISNLTELNFDYKDSGHCGAGAPRFNVQVDGNTYFLGCTQGTHTPVAGNTGWTHVVFGPADFAAAGIPTTGTLEDLYMIFDEGTDTPTGGSIVTAGQVYLDNISVNGVSVGNPSTPQSKDECKNGAYKNFGDKFKNQGQCISYFNHVNKAQNNH